MYDPCYDFEAFKRQVEEVIANAPAVAKANKERQEEFNIEYRKALSWLDKVKGTLKRR